ncbi:MAG: cofactor-independent phosphoglycerate mutase [Desulfobulbus sp.]|nr:MAG: cofactor-independent phosphoglycerate mutase [Desulfobulbus sp.]
MKYILLIGDGMGDTPVPELGNKTPLEAARKPVIDRLCKEGEALLVTTVPEGFPPGSDVANLSLMGYEPEKYYTGRAPLEAASMGVDVLEDEIAFRCNLVNVRYLGDKVDMIDYSAGHISTAEADELIRAVQETCGTEKLTLYPGISYRHLLIHKGAVPKSLHTVPPHDYMDQDVTEFYRQYMAVDYLADLMRRSAQVLADHPVNHKRVAEGKRPANALWIWGEGAKPSMESLEERYGVSGSLISAVDLLKGLGVCSGLEVLEVEGATGYIDTNYQGKVDAALDALARKDFVLVHVEAPDEAGHNGSLADKLQAIEDFDAKIVAPIVREMDRRQEKYRLVVTMDHYTPLARRTHEDWPVPMFIYDSTGVENPGRVSYTEKNIHNVVKASGGRLAGGADFFARFVKKKGAAHG